MKWVPKQKEYRLGSVRMFPLSTTHENLPACFQRLRHNLTHASLSIAAIHAMISHSVTLKWLATLNDFTFQIPHLYVHDAAAQDLRGVAGRFSVCAGTSRTGLNLSSLCIFSPARDHTAKACPTRVQDSKGIDHWHRTRPVCGHTEGSHIA